jgi:hypothetical protein
MRCRGPRNTFSVNWSPPGPSRNLLDAVEAGRVEPHWRQDRATVRLGHAEDQVAAAQVVEVVGERAQGVQHRQRIPAGLELQPLPLGSLPTEQIGNVHRQG